MSANKIVMRVLNISFTAFLVLLLAYGLYRLGVQSYDYGYRVFTEPPTAGGEGRDRIIRITDSMSDLEVGELLEKKGLVRDKWLFVLQVNLSEYGGIVPGHYTLNTSMTAQEMIQVMSGKTEEE